MKLSEQAAQKNVQISVKHSINVILTVMPNGVLSFAPKLDHSVGAAGQNDLAL